MAGSGHDEGDDNKNGHNGIDEEKAEESDEKQTSTATKQNPNDESQNNGESENDQSKTWLLAALALIVVIAIAVGIAVPLSRREGPSSPSPSTSNMQVPSAAPPTENTPSPSTVSLTTENPSGAPSTPSPSASPTPLTPSPSAGPTPTGDPLVIIANRLNIADLSSLEDDSPRLLALNWMAYNDSLRDELLQSTNSTSDRILLERYVLVLFYFSTDGPEWLNNYNFLSNSSVCSWNSAGSGVFCDEDEVTAIGIGKYETLCH